MVGTSGRIGTRFGPVTAEKRPKLVGFDQIDHRQHGDEHEGIGAVQEVADRLRELRVGNVLRPRAGLQFELLAD